MLKPLADKIIVKLVAEDTKTAGGIFLPDSAKEQKPQAEVVAVGSGLLLKDGTRKELAVKVGDKVLFPLHMGMEIKVNGEEYAIVREQDILAIID